LVVESTPRALATAMDRLRVNSEEAVKMGKHGPRTVAQKGISWENVVARLLG
jgi:glycosyltransferase involved in cell wall biosynthesis